MTQGTSERVMFCFRTGLCISTCTTVWVGCKPNSIVRAAAPAPPPPFPSASHTAHI